MTVLGDVFVLGVGVLVFEFYTTVVKMSGGAMFVQGYFCTSKGAWPFSLNSIGS